MAVGMIDNAASDVLINQAQRVVDMWPSIGLLEPGEQPLLVGLRDANIQERPAFSSQVQWLIDELHPRYADIPATITAVAASITVSAGQGAYFKSGDQAMIEETQETVIVGGVIGDVVSVSRGYSVVAGTATTVATKLIRVIHSAAEGASYPTPKQTVKQNLSNYTHIARTACAWNGTLLEEKLYGQDPVMPYQVKKSGIEHEREWEAALFLGRKKLDTTVLGSQASPLHTMGGLKESIVTNVSAATANMTQPVFDAFLRDRGFRFGSKTKIGICAPIYLSMLSGWNYGKVQPTSYDGNSVGSSVTRYRVSTGEELILMQHRDWADFYQSAANTISPNSLGNSLFILDLDDIRLRPLRTTKYLENRQNPGEDKRVNEYLTEMSMQWGDERKHAIMRGVVSYS